MTAQNVFERVQQVDSRVTYPQIVDELNQALALFCRTTRVLQNYMVVHIENLPAGPRGDVLISIDGSDPKEHPYYLKWAVDGYYLDLPETVVQLDDFFPMDANQALTKYPMAAVLLGNRLFFKSDPPIETWPRLIRYLKLWVSYKPALLTDVVNEDSGTPELPVPLEYHDGIANYLAGNHWLSQGRLQEGQAAMALWGASVREAKKAASMRTTSIWDIQRDYY